MKPTIKIAFGLATFALAASANAASTVINFGTNNAALTNNYANPDVALYTAGAGNFTTSLTGTSAGAGTNYNTVQVFKDQAGTNLDLTLSIHRTNGKVFTTPATAFNNSTAVSDMTATLGAFDTSALSSYINPGAGGSRIDTITLNNLHNGAQASYDAVFYFAVSALDGSLTSIAISGGTQTSLEFAGQGRTGFDSTLATSEPGSSEITLVKWTGTLSNTQQSLTITLNGGKAGISTIAYVIPEPSALTLLGLSALALVTRRKR